MAETSPSKPEVLLHWTHHPFARRPWLGTGVIVFLLMILGWLQVVTQSTLLVVVATLFFTINLSAFFFPTRYYLCREEVIVRGLFTQRQPWSKFRKYIATDRGVILSPFLRPTFRDGYRGVWLETPSEELREEVLALVEEKVDYKKGDKEESSKAGAEEESMVS